MGFKLRIRALDSAPETVVLMYRLLVPLMLEEEAEPEVDSCPVDDNPDDAPPPPMPLEDEEDALASDDDDDAEDDEDEEEDEEEPDGDEGKLTLLLGDRSLLC